MLEGDAGIKLTTDKKAGKANIIKLEEDNSIHSSVPYSAIEEALHSLESIERDARRSVEKSAGNVVYELDDNDDDSVQELQDLLQLLGDDGEANTSPTEDDTSEEEKIVAPTNVRSAEEVSGGDEIISRLLAIEDREPEADHDSEDGPAKHKVTDEQAKLKAEAHAANQELNDLLDKKEEQLQVLIEHQERLRKDFELYKKRVEREAKEKEKSANEQLLLKILPILDSFERAISHAQQADDPRAFEEGVLLIYKQFKDMLSNFGLEPIESLNELFDPNFHEAVIQMDEPDRKPNTVTSEIQKGYMLHGRLLRPAKVAVALDSGKKNAGGGETSESGNNDDKED